MRTFPVEGRCAPPSRCVQRHTRVRVEDRARSWQNDLVLACANTQQAVSCTIWSMVRCLVLSWSLPASCSATSLAPVLCSKSPQLYS